jgi:hypothetical protein
LRIAARSESGKIVPLPALSSRIRYQSASYTRHKNKTRAELFRFVAFIHRSFCEDGPHNPAKACPDLIPA